MEKSRWSIPLEPAPNMNILPQNATCFSGVQRLPADMERWDQRRFILHGLDLYTAQGKPIRVSVHVLRHVMATHARQVPPEAIAQFFLHHRLKALTGRSPSTSEISEYY